MARGRCRMRYYRYVPEVHICIHKCTRPMLFLHNRTTALHKCTPTGSLVPSRGIVVKAGNLCHYRLRRPRPIRFSPTACPDGVPLGQALGDAKASFPNHRRLRLPSARYLHPLGLTVPSRSHSHPTYGSLRQSRTLSRGFICCPRGRYVYVNTGYGYVETTFVWYTSVYIYVLGYISVVPHTTTTPSAVLCTRFPLAGIE